MKKNEIAASELAETDKTNIDPRPNTNSTSTQVQNLDNTYVSQQGNTTDGKATTDPKNTTPIRSNPQNNKPMSVDGNSKAGRGSDKS
ncbi:MULTISPECIES: hypothetical protein [Hymenobacter]|uniref:Uncharacterized protein n=2 Tax=Hymenobacter TaxID=89966 RepID=A0ABS6X1R8_9BACT|nr:MULTISPECIES: hypothetical protein [Hymenobacter]MBO3270296.1 hypothetical protein [Hymenobacter defluvii]MBW3129604.1 hypothetical protein [Hymenobacter profundi]QNE38076.1 hypothetical protein F1C16_00140 [Hymenobacter sp. NBH84]